MRTLATTKHIPDDAGANDVERLRSEAIAEWATEAARQGLTPDGEPVVDIIETPANESDGPDAVIVKAWNVCGPVLCS